MKTVLSKVKQKIHTFTHPTPSTAPRQKTPPTPHTHTNTHTRTHTRTHTQTPYALREKHTNSVFYQQTGSIHHMKGPLLTRAFLLLLNSLSIEVQTVE